MYFCPSISVNEPLIFSCQYISDTNITINKKKKKNYEGNRKQQIQATNKLP